MSCLSRKNHLTLFLIPQQIGPGLQPNLHFPMALDGQHIKKVNEKDGFFDATSSLDKIQNYVESFDSTKRVLQSVDLFGGHGNFAKVCHSKGKSCEGIDVLYEPQQHNMLSEEGFFHILNTLLAVVSRMFMYNFSYVYFTIVCLDA